MKADYAMLRLSREIRFAWLPPGSPISGRPDNSWAGWPSANLMVPQLRLRCEIEGHPDSTTGYVCNIKLLDQCMRAIVCENLIAGNCKQLSTAEFVLDTVYRELHQRWDHASTIASVQLELSPCLQYSILIEDNMNQPVSQSPRVRLTQQFEFSAAHRLHCHDLSEDENRQLFGKCNNPAGHGHNYVVEVSVSNQPEMAGGQVIELAKFESIVKRLVIDRLDHKHLNQDVAYFNEVNPTVENISIAIYDWLSGNLIDARLEKVKVFETPKTWAEYSGTG